MAVSIICAVGIIFYILEERKQRLRDLVTCLRLHSQLTAEQERNLRW